MFQRKGKSHAASPFDGPEKIDTFKLARLFEECGEELDGDAAHYMEQVADYFRNHYKPGKDLNASKVLGL